MAGELGRSILLSSMGCFNVNVNLQVPQLVGFIQKEACVVRMSFGNSAVRVLMRARNGSAVAPVPKISM